MSSGHPNAASYPLDLLYEEASLVVERKNREDAMHAVYLQCAVATMVSKEAGKEFKNMIGGLLDDQ